MKKSSIILLGIAAVLAAAFVVKNVIDYGDYQTHINSAPFDLVVGINALLLVLPAAFLAAIAFSSEKKKHVLMKLAAIFTTAAVEEFVRMKAVRGFVAADSLLMSSPYIAAAAIFAAFMTVLMVKNGGEKTLSRILLSISGAITAGFVIMCIIMTVANKGRDSFTELFTMFFLYAIFFLLPAAILAATALFLRGKTVALVTGAVISALLVVLIVFLSKDLPIIAMPAVVSAALCVIFAVKSKKRGKI